MNQARESATVTPILDAIVARAATIKRDIKPCGCERLNDDGEIRDRLCPDHAVEIQQEGLRRMHRIARAERIRDLQNLLRGAGFLREHAGAKLEDFPPELGAKATAWLDGPDDRAGLLIKGPVGTGKTRLAAALSGAFLVDGASVMAVATGDLFGRIRATFRENSTESEEQLVESLKSVGLLVVDDLGTEGTVSPFVVQTLHRVISARNGDWQPTILTTNLKVDEIRAAYGDRIASRLGCWEQIVVDGADRRRQA